jgi:hypothetical protein
MQRDLTDLSGIGSKTAEKLEDEGIEDAGDLAEARRDGDPALQEFNTRVQKAAIDAAQERYGSYRDPRLGVRVTDANRDTIDLTTSNDASSLTDSGRITRNKSEFQDDTLLDLGRKAVRGAGLQERVGDPPSQDEISETIVTPNASGEGEVEDRSRIEDMQARRNFVSFGFDVASELANADREDIKRANEIRAEASPRGRKDPSTDFTETYEYTIAGETKQSERDVRVNPREYAAAKRVHQARSPDAKRVDNRRKANVTGDFDEWIDDPRRHDFPGVDTPERGSAAGSSFGYTPDETSLEASLDFTPADQDNEFQVQETSADGGGGFGRIESKAGEILSASQDTQRLVLNDLLPDEEQRDEIGVEPRGPDRELFNSDAEGDFVIPGFDGGDRM